MSPNKHEIHRRYQTNPPCTLAIWHETCPCIYGTAYLAKEDINKYHYLIPVCLLGLTVFKKCNSNNQFMMNEGNKCLPSSVATFPHTAGGQKSYRGGEIRSLKYFAPPPPGKNLQSAPLQVLVRQCR